MIHTLEEFKRVVAKHEESNETLYAIGQVFGDPRDPEVADSWSALVWAPKDVEWADLEEAVKTADGGEYLWALSPLATNVYVQRDLLSDVSTGEIWKNWACEFSDEWRTFCADGK